MNFWERLDELIIMRGLTRKHVTMTAGIADNSISLWKKRGTYPAGDVLLSVSETLGVTVEYLITGVDRRYTPVNLVGSLRSILSSGLPADLGADGGLLVPKR